MLVMVVVAVVAVVVVAQTAPNTTQKVLSCNGPIDTVVHLAASNPIQTNTHPHRQIESRAPKHSWDAASWMDHWNGVCHNRLNETWIVLNQAKDKDETRGMDTGWRSTCLGLVLFNSMVEKRIQQREK